jgi:hypothetical protein
MCFGPLGVCFKEAGFKGRSGSYSNTNSASSNYLTAADFAADFQDATDGVPLGG